LFEDCIENNVIYVKIHVLNTDIKRISDIYKETIETVIFALNYVGITYRKRIENVYVSRLEAT